MMTNADRLHAYGPSGATVAQKVVIVNGNSDALELLETALNAGHYDVVFVESNEHAYSQVKRVRPDLVILCVQFGETAGLQVLSMLKLDADTRNIPVLTFTTDSSDEESEESVAERSDADMFAPKPAVWMN